MKNFLKFSIKLWLLAVGVFLINDVSANDPITGVDSQIQEGCATVKSTACNGTSNVECKKAEIEAAIEVKQIATECVNEYEESLNANRANLDREKARLQAAIGERDAILQRINELEGFLDEEGKRLKELNEARLKEIQKMQENGCELIEKIRKEGGSTAEITLPGGQTVPFTPPKYCVQFFESIGGNTSVQGDTGMDLFSSYVRILYQYGAALIGFVAVLVIVISGVQIMMGGMSQENISSAKTRILQAIFSIMLLFGSALILKTINPGFFT